ncbi:MAG: Hsp33 family molecular chaperone [Pseudomonadota bacterium]
MGSARNAPQHGTAFDTPDDSVLPFSTVKSKALGRIVRLGPLLDKVLSRHAYPESVSEVLGQAIALAAMLGSTLKFEGNLIVQTKTDGPIGMLVVNFETPGRIRAHASFDRERLADAGAAAAIARKDYGALLGEGYLALTIDPGQDMERYQGIVALDGQDLAASALQYFRQSEQLPTFVRLAVARLHTRGDNGDTFQWRAGGLLVQHVTPLGGKDSEDKDDDLLLGEHDDHWCRVEYLARTLEDHEILDPTLAPERLLYRLFHEEGVRTSEARQLELFCRCSQDRIQRLFRSFKPEEIAEFRDSNGDIVVTCEFCHTTYNYQEDEH